MARQWGAVVGTPGLLLNFEGAVPHGAAFSFGIGADRTLGFGLKYATAFGDIRLGYIGR
jgi:hypothetical protein